MKSCIFTIVYNEKYFLPLWLKYYSSHFEHKDIFILDNDSTIPYKINKNINLIPTPSTYCFDSGWLKQTIHNKLNELLKIYETVVFVEVDEFLIPNKLLYPQGLKQFIEENKENHVTATGFDLIQKENEPNLNKNPIFTQRIAGNLSIKYNKTLINKKFVTWERGFHKCNEEIDPNPNLFLVHMHYLDKEIAWNRHVERLKKTFQPDELKKGFSFQNAPMKKEKFLDMWPIPTTNLSNNFQIPFDMVKLG